MTRNPSEGATDVVVAGGVVIDGTGAPGRRADVLIADGVIVDLLAPGSQIGDRPVLDATGLVVCPGFIDAHSHADSAPFLSEPDLTKVRQGVTTEIIGNCGKSLAPAPPPGASPGGEDSFEPDFLAHQRQFFGIAGNYGPSVADWFAAIDAAGPIVNCAPLIGHGTLRSTVMGYADRPANDDDLRAMARLLAEGMDAGAFGLSSGLIYAPGMFSSTAELCAIAAGLPAGAVYATHMRNEGDALDRSLDEAIAVGRQAGVRVEVSHLKVTGRENWGRAGRALAKLDAARASGVAIGQDAYPYPAASTSLAACLPPWTHAGGASATLRRLTDPADRDLIRRHITGRAPFEWENTLAGVGADGVLIVTTASGRFEGHTLQQIAGDLDLDPVDALMHVLIAEDLAVSMVDFSMDERDVRTVLMHPETVIGSDGLAPGRGGRPHPRLFGTFPRILGEYVREQRALTLEGAIARMTGDTAERFRIPQRGRLARGLVADLVALDPATIGHPADYLDPDQPPTGIAWVMLAGAIVVRGGSWTGARAGRRLVPAR